MSYPAPPEEKVTWKIRFLRAVTWWHGGTLDTRFWTGRFGELVGYDESGDAYYRTIGGPIDPALGFERRWVIYRGGGEGSAMPPDPHAGSTTETPAAAGRTGVCVSSSRSSASWVRLPQTACRGLRRNEPGGALNQFADATG